MRESEGSAQPREGEGSAQPRESEGSAQPRESERSAQPREGKRPCRKCLLREMDEEAYLRQLHRYIQLLDADVKAAQSLYERRLSACRSCDYLEAGTCLACGCYVELRAAVKKNRCPYKKW